MIEDGRVNAAYRFCENQQGNNAYRSRVMNMPAMIKTNGMAAAIAFLYSKKNDQERAYQQLYSDIEEWLADKLLIDKKDGGLMEQLSSMDSDQYQMITLETMALLNWLKRFAEAFCKQPN